MKIITPIFQQSVCHLNHYLATFGPKSDQVHFLQKIRMLIVFFTNVDSRLPVSIIMCRTKENKMLQKTNDLKTNVKQLIQMEIEHLIALLWAFNLSFVTWYN